MKSFNLNSFFTPDILRIGSVVDDPFPRKLVGTISFQLRDGIRCLESEAQDTELSLEVAKIQFSLSGL